MWGLRVQGLPKNMMSSRGYRFRVGGLRVQGLPKKKMTVMMRVMVILVVMTMVMEVMTATTKASPLCSSH